MTEFWRWKEYRWTSPDLDWRAADVVSGGIDVGSVSTQAVLMADGQLYAYSNMRTGSNSPDSARRGLDSALEGTGMKQEDIDFIVGTGYGRVNIPFANKAVTEIACHAKGANFVYGPSVRTVLDMGGQDCKAIRCDEKGKVTAFLMNDKCAAGTGRGLEVFADLLQVHVEDIGELSFQIEKEPPPVSSTCVVFAKSEAATLLRKGVPKNEVIAAYCSAMAHRVFTLLERLGVEKDFGITGGVSKNAGIVKRLEKELGLVSIPSKHDPQIAGGIGAALFARSLVEKQKQGG